jgi:RNA polymerase sigma-70 factor (ECF subfamily)
MTPHASEAAAGHGSPQRRGLDREEFARCFQESSRTLWTIAAGILGDPSRAEDVLQDACMIALTKLEQFERGTSFPAWMGQVVRNVARNEARKGARRATRPVPPDALAEILPDEAHPGADVPVPPDALVDARGELVPGRDAFDDELEHALTELRPVQRAALLLRTLRGLDYREISAALGIPEGTAMSHVHRARQALRRRLTASEPEARRAAPDAEVGGGAG